MHGTGSPVSGEDLGPGCGQSVKPEAESQEQLGWGVGEVARIWVWDLGAGGVGGVQTQGSVDLEGVWTPERTEAWKGLISTRSQGCGKSLDSESNRAESGVPGGGNTRSWPRGTEDRGGAECGETEGASEAWTNLEGVSSLDL